jgi:hypothetical protein
MIQKIASLFCSDPSKRVDFVIVHETDKLDAVDDHRSVHQRRRVFQVTAFSYCQKHISNTSAKAGLSGNNFFLQPKTCIKHISEGGSFR